jgi:hypothetical protein
MAETTTICVICHEIMEPIHTVVEPENCTHKFHVICINVWLAHKRSCPVCRAPISVATQMPWRTLFLMTLAISRESLIERSAYTYAFLSLLLRRYKTAANWTEHRESIITSVQQFSVEGIRLPFLDVSSRTTAKREKQRWAKFYEELEEGKLARTSERIGNARRTIIHSELFYMIAFT